MTRLRVLATALATSVAGSLISITAAEAATISVARPAGGKVSVVWPVGTGSTPTVVAPGARLRVEVKQASRGSHPVTIAFAPAAKGAAGARTKTLRKGVFSVTVSAKAGDRYTLKLRSGKRTLRTSTIAVGTTPPAPGNSALPGPTPTPTPSLPQDPCAVPETTNGTITGTLTAPTTKLISRAGQNVPDLILVQSTLSNTGSGCFGPPSVFIERLVDGVWTATTRPTGVGTPAIYYTVRPGQTTEASWFFNADEPAGELRLRVGLHRGALISPTQLPAGAGSVEATFSWAGPAAPPIG